MRLSWQRKAFLASDYIFLACSSLLCLFPLIHVLALSFSSAPAANAGEVVLLPIGFTLKSYAYVAAKAEFFNAFIVTLERLAIGIPLSMFLITTAAYPMSKPSRTFRLRPVFIVFYLIPMVFSGGLIPWYMAIRSLGMLDKIWALVLPASFNIFNMILLLNFFRSLPKEIEEAAFIDGSNHFQSLWHIYIPLSKPAIATILLFTMVTAWNSWFDGLILMNNPKHYPLQSYLQTVVIVPSLTAVSSKQFEELREISDRTTKAAQIFVATVPILLVYPYLQKYFMKGIVLGSVKG